MIYLTLPIALFSAVLIVDKTIFCTSICNYLDNIKNRPLNLNISYRCSAFVGMIFELVVAMLWIALLLPTTLFFILIIQQIGVFSIFFYFNLNQDVRFSCDMSTYNNYSVIWRDVAEWLFNCSSEYALTYHILSFNWKRDTIDLKKRLFCINFAIWKYHL